jgi:hypothetical protein
MTWRPAAIGLALLAVTVGTGIAVRAFEFAGLGQQARVDYYPEPTPTATPVPANFIMLDLDLDTPGVQRERTMASGAQAQIAIVAERITQPYRGYQWQLGWSDSGLDFISAVENSGEHGATLCAPAWASTDPALGVPPGREWAGLGAGCLNPDHDMTFTGELTRIIVQCVSDGTHHPSFVRLSQDELFGTTYIASGGGVIPTGYGLNGFLTCGAPLPTATPPPANTIALDADASGPGLQSSRAVDLGATAEIAIVATDVPTAYQGYQWEVQWPDDGLDFVTNAENSAGHGGTLCAGAATSTNWDFGVPFGMEWAGRGAGCLRPDGTTSFEGDLVRITVRCIADGEQRIELVGIVADPSFGSSMIGSGGTLLPTTFGAPINIQCGSGSTPTPSPTVPTATPTPTPVAPSATLTPSPVPPTATPSPTPVPPTATPTPDSCRADVNGDGRVTGRDLSRVIRALHRGYNAAADVNGDGAVDLRDLRLVLFAVRDGRC